MSGRSTPDRSTQADALARGDWLADRARRTPRAEALRAEGETVSWAELAAEARGLAHWLAERGVRPGDTVATAVPHGRRLVPLVHAVASLGATLLPLHARLGPSELAPMLADAGARMLVADEGPGVDAARTAARRVPAVHLHALPAAPPAPAAAPAAGSMDGAGELARPAPASGGGASRASATARTAHQPAAPRALLFTSGTTGRARGAELSHAAFFWSAMGAALHLGTEMHSRWLACLPLYHVGGLAVLSRSVLLGGSVIVHDRFDEGAVSRALDTLQATGLSLVPTMLARLLDARRDAPPPSSLRGVLVGGAALPEPLLLRAWRAGWPVLPTYGLTEACSQVATLPPADVGRRPGVAGRPLPVTRIAITDAAGRALPAGREGEIRVRGATVMDGYRGDPEATERALEGGWLRTGDVGVLDVEGFLRVLDRRDDLIVSGGENVYPAEVEAVLASHPAVAEAAVAPEPDPVFGQRVAAWVVPRPGARIDAHEIAAHCRKHLAGYKVPRAVYGVAALPRNALGKVLRRRLAGEGDARRGAPRS